jgi:hypothetical protein
MPGTTVKMKDPCLSSPVDLNSKLISKKIALFKI